MKKATHQATKDHNTTLVLRTVYHQALISRAEVARATGLTRTTVSDLITELIDAGYVREAGPGPATIGKPPIHVYLDAGAKQILCVDLGEEEFHGALVNLRGEVLQRHTLPLGDRTGAAALDLAHRLVDGLRSQASAPLLGIGIGTPGRVDPDAGVIRQAVNRGWVDVDLRKSLGERHRIPIHLGNDAHLAALAECAYGGHGRAPSLALIKVGQGIGSGLVFSGALHLGDGFSAGEVGHLCVERGGRPCSCGNRGCLETVAALPALSRQLQELAAKAPETPFARALRDPQPALEVWRTFSADGNPQARGLVRALGTHLGVVAASLVGVLNIRKVVIAGVPVAFGEPVLEALRAELRARILPEQAEETQVSFSALGSDLVLKGAAALVLRNQLNLP